MDYEPLAALLRAPVQHYLADWQHAPQQLARAFQAVLRPERPGQLKAADEFIAEQEKKPEFMLSLLQLIEHFPTPEVRLQAFICLSNVVKRKWNCKMLEKEFLKEFEKAKAVARKAVLRFLFRPEEPYSKFAVETVLTIAKHDFPQQFPELMTLLLGRCANLQSSNFCGSALSFLKTIEKIMKVRSTKRGGWEKLQGLVSAFSVHFSLEAVPSEKSRRVCKGLLYSLYSLERNLQTDPGCRLLCLALYKRAGWILENGKALSEQEEFWKELKGLVYMLSCLQSMLPLLFSQFLESHLLMLEKTMSLEQVQLREKVAKSCILSYSKCISNFFFSSADPKVVFGLKLDEAMTQRHAEVHSLHSRYFEMRGADLALRLVGTFMRRNDRSEAIDFDDVTYANEEIGAQIENSQFNCCMITLKQLVGRFPRVCCDTLLQMLRALPTVPLELQLSIVSFATLFYETDVYKQVIGDLLSFCFGGRQQLVNRVPELLIKASNHMSDETVLPYMARLLQAMKSGDKQLVYYGCLRLKNLTLQYKSRLLESFLHEASQQLISLMVKILPGLSVHLLWPIINLLIDFFRINISNLPLLETTLSDPFVQALFQSDNELVYQAVAELFVKVLPADSPVIELAALRFIECQAALRNCDLRLWYYVIRDSSHLQALKPQLTSMYNRLFEQLCLKKPTSSLMFIFEEMVLTGLVQLQFDQIVLFFSRLLALDEQVFEDDLLDFQSAVLSAFVTMLLAYKPPISAYFDLVKFAIQQGLKAEPVESSEEAVFRTGCMMVVSRCVLSSVHEFFAQLNRQGLNLQAFFGAWIRGMKVLTSKVSCRINLLAFITALPYLDSGLFLAEHPFLFQIMVAELNYYKALKASPLEDKPAKDNFTHRVSDRKAELRRRNDFSQVDIPRLVREGLGKYLGDTGLGLGSFGQNPKAQELSELLSSAI